MKYFYFLLITCFFSTTALGQIGKPIHTPTPSKNGKKRVLKPIQTSLLNGIPSARTSVITAFTPPTLPTLHRKPTSERIKVVERSKTGAPIMIKGTLDQISAGRDIDLQVFDYLQAIKAPILIKSPTEEFKIIARKTDNLGQTHFKMQQEFAGLKVYGGQVWLHAQDGKVNLFNGRNYPTPNLENTTPSISKTGAQEIANHDVSLKTTIKTLNEWEQKLIGEQKEPELLVYHPINGEKAQLAWHYRFHPNVSNEWEYFIDAQSGVIIDAYKTLCQLHYHLDFDNKTKECIDHDNSQLATPSNSTLQSNQQSRIDNRQLTTDNTPQNGPAVSNATDLNGANQTMNSYEIGNDFFLIDAARPMYNGSRSRLPNDPVGAIWTINAQNTYPENDDFNAVHLVTSNNNWSDPISVSAHSNAGFAYDYFRTTFGRNSINGNGGTILSVINVSDEDGSGLDNAFWTGTAMFYGNGNTAFQPLARSLDVAGHEIAHGVVQNTANLRYQGESGAMNESFADVFGVLIDRDDYQLGEDVVNRNIFRSGALRDMADPHNGGTRLGDPGYQPDRVAEQFFGKQDNGGVHINSGITNRAFFLVSNTIGRDKAEQIYYRALTTYLVNTSEFVDLRASLLQSAADIHGGGSQEVSVIAQAFDIVGVLGSDTGSGEQSGGAVEEEVDPNPGSDFVVYTDDNKENLYVADGSGEIVGLISDSGVLSKPSVTDDGSVIVFVGGDKTIRAIQIDWAAGGTFEEIVVQDQPIWRNAAISRQGNLIAALDADRINTIDVFNLETSELKTFELYNPTFTEGISTGDVEFADIIEFDFTGEYVMYDAQNAIKGDFGGNDITYWDISFIKVFDNSINDYETDVSNNIFKLFAGLPEDVSIGNPTFSKNSPNILAYEYIDAFNTTEAEEQIYEIRGLNASTNTVSTIFSSLNLNVPSYSRLDDKIIFNFLSDNKFSIAEISLEEDKISPASEDGSFFIQQMEGAQLGVWFSDGTRQLTATNELEKAIFDLQIAPNPFSENLTIQFTLEERKDLLLEIYNTLGQVQLSQKVEANIGLNNQQLNTQQLSTGTYFVTLKSAEGIVTRKVVK